DFSIICSLVQTAGLDAALSEGGPITIFLPNDNAFVNLGEDLVDLLTANENRLVLEEVLLNHVVASQSVVLEADLDCDASVPMLSGETTSTICVTGDVFQIGVGNLALQDEELLPQIVDTDTTACNGVVHEVSNLILTQSVADLVDEAEGGGDDDDDDDDSPDMVEPACSPNIVDIACDDDDFSILCEALQATDLDRVLTQEGPFTVFAPTDDAFLELGQAALNELLEEDRLATLTDILLYHVVVEEEVFSDDLVCLGMLEMGNGDLTRTICARRSERRFQIGRGNGRSVRTFPEIVIPDVEACNGVIHGISRVILPKFEDSTAPGGSQKSGKSSKSSKSKSSKSGSKSTKKKKVKRTKK
ncbi:MAG: hypothetical protein SGILL_001056, partial [Bacillariaceae sp.]